MQQHCIGSKCLRLATRHELQRLGSSLAHHAQLAGAADVTHAMPAQGGQEGQALEQELGVS